jgi:hypothetical protein
MNFQNLYSRVFVNEDDGSVPQIAADTEPQEDTTTPMPDKYDVEPMPIPKNTGNAVHDLEGYISKLEEFLLVLNGTKEDSLQRFVVSAEGQSSLLKGIADETTDTIVDIAGKLATLVQTFNGFVTNVERRKREISARPS